MRFNLSAVFQVLHFQSLAIECGFFAVCRPSSLWRMRIPYVRICSAPKEEDVYERLLDAAAPSNKDFRCAYTTVHPSYAASWTRTESCSSQAE